MENERKMKNENKKIGVMGKILFFTLDLFEKLFSFLMRFFGFSKEELEKMKLEVKENAS